MISILKAVSFLILVILNLMFHFTLIVPFSLGKFIPIEAMRRASVKIITSIATRWSDVNSFLIDLIIKTRIDLQFSERTQLLNKKLSYAVIVNHQSSVDILVLQYLFSAKVPYFKYFLKKELMWVPMLNLAWWALDFPFMKRYTREQLKRKPHLAGKDLEVVRKMVATYKKQKVAILNFVEGSRRTTERALSEGKKRVYQHLLRPHSSGLSVVLSFMKDQLEGVLDITILYPQENVTMKDFIKGKIPWIKVYADLIPLEEVPIEPNGELAHLSKGMHRWLNERWQLKDEWLAEEKQKAGLVTTI